MELSPEDALRLNVMLANRPQAVRIDESRMILYALSEQGEMEIPLNPTVKDELYLKWVRELLSTKVLGTPAGYPLHLRRWTRMGHLSLENVEELLLLGEPEAVVAVVHSQDLTDELARRAWWAMEDAENARQLLRQPAVVAGTMGPRLAAWLVEFLPFETEAETIMETLALVLQPGLLEPEVKEELWKRARRKNAYYVGFLATVPDELPDQAPPHPRWESCRESLQALAEEGNALAGLLQRVYSPQGQLWLATLARVLEKPSNQDVVNRTLEVAAGYFAAARPEGPADATFEELEAEAATWLQINPEALAVLQACPDSEGDLAALRILSGSGYGMVRPIFRKTDAIGTLMRRKLEPVMKPYLGLVARLRGQG